MSLEVGWNWTDCAGLFVDDSRLRSAVHESQSKPELGPRNWGRAGILTPGLAGASPQPPRKHLI